MKRDLRLLLVAVVIFTFTKLSFAQEAATSPGVGSPEKKTETRGPSKLPGKPSRVEGELMAVDLAAGTLRVKAKDKEMSFITEGKEAKSRLEKATVGQMIRVFYYEKEGKFMAKSLAGGLGGNEPAKKSN
jgi:hypothetical protein